VPLEGSNVPLPCSLPDGRKICCAAVTNDTQLLASSRGVGLGYLPKERDGRDLRDGSGTGSERGGGVGGGGG
jgi:hypothetical protein